MPTRGPRGYSPAVQSLSNPAPAPALGSYEDGFEPLARRFASNLADGLEIGAGLAVYHRGRCVADLWGGLADARTRRLFEHDSRVVVFSVTKGFAAMALHLLADRGQLEWSAPVATYWPGFAEHGKEDITVATLLGHRGGLPYLDTPLTLDDCTDPARAERVLEALEAQRPAWEPGTDQGYHAITYGMYARELFERIAGEPLGPFLRRELFEPLGSDVHLGTPPSEDARMATLYPPSMGERVVRMVGSAIVDRDANEVRVARASMGRRGLPRLAFTNPATGKLGIVAYDSVPVRRAALAWASATASAQGVARAYLPFASGGAHEGRRYVTDETLHGAYARLGWSERDRVLQKPLGWSNGFLKEERHLFSPNPESFGHAGMGGALGWCDPVEELTFGYVMNKMDWRVRSPRALSLCRALYECDPIRARARARMLAAG
jgi:CubicO group peptidase (beta-lactamase class C family)